MVNVRTRRRGVLGDGGTRCDDLKSNRIKYNKIIIKYTTLAQRASEALSFTLTSTIITPASTRPCLASCSRLIIYLPSPLLLSPPFPSFSHPLHQSPSRPSCPFSAIIYSSHILFAHASQHHSITIPSANLIIDSSIQAPFYRSSCIGFLILNSFVLSNLPLHSSCSLTFLFDHHHSFYAH